MMLQVKIEIINSLIASLLVYKMQSLPKLSSKSVKRINDQIVKFIWSGRKPKIKLEHLQLDKRDGGLQLVNILARDAALKAQWVKNIQKGDIVMHELVKDCIPNQLQNTIFWECNFNVQDSVQFSRYNKFWNHVVESWAQFNYE